MEPTLEVGQRVLVDRVSPRFCDPERGDIVVFKPPRAPTTTPSVQCASSRTASPAPSRRPSGPDTNFIKRVVGVPGRPAQGDRRPGLHQRQAQQNEPFIVRTSLRRTCNLPKEITIPPGHFFMMGDNRGQSDDSRAWGPVPKDWIIGEAFFTYWPPKRIGTP